MSTVNAMATPHNHLHCPAGLVEVIWWSIPAPHLLLAAGAAAAIVIPRQSVCVCVLWSGAKSPVRRNVGTRVNRCFTRLLNEAVRP